MNKKDEALGHTPGPWTAIADRCHYDSLTTVIAGLVSSKKVIPAQSIIQVGGHADIDELEANARLIAAAPDLLECAQSLLDALDRDLPFRMKHHAAGERFNLRAAISKATGDRNE